MWTFRSLNELDRTEGTVTLVDAGHTLNLKDVRNTDVVLIPQPSDDVNDPLNWPFWKKLAAFTTIVWFAALDGWLTAGPSSAIPILVKEFQRDLNSITTGVISWCILVLGLGNFFWVPVGSYFGRRPSFLVASALFFGTTIWSAAATSYGSLVAARVINAFAGAATEGLGAAVVADMFFLHERGRWMSVYIFFLVNGTTFGTIVSGFVITNLGWRWLFWVTSILAGVGFLGIVFLFPETLYFRKPGVGQGQSETSSYDGKENTSQEVIAPVIPKNSYLQELKPWSPINPQASLLNLFFRPFPLVAYPAIFFAFISFATILGWSVCVTSTNANVFQKPPYNMSPGINSLIKLPGLIGVAIGSIYAGTLTDKCAQWYARKHNGIFEPETRLLALIAPFIIVPGGLLMYGWGIQHLTHWAVPFIGNGLIGFGAGSIPSIAFTYMVDSYYPIASEGLLLASGLKNVFAFGFSYGIVPWVARNGFGGAFSIMVGIQSGVVLLGLPLWYFGKRIRHASAAWKVISW